MMSKRCRLCAALVLWAGALLGPGAELQAQGLSRKLFVLPTARLDLGPLWLLTDAHQSGFTAHITGGVAIGWPGIGLERYFTPSIWLYPELSYDYRDVALRGSHTLSAGLGVGWGNLLWVNGGYGARLSAGVNDGLPAVGMRHGFFARFLGTLFNLELTHQLLSAGGIISHELQFTAGLNLGSTMLLAQ
jgi:hypothetical protein